MIELKGKAREGKGGEGRSDMTHGWCGARTVYRCSLWLNEISRAVDKFRLRI